MTRSYDGVALVSPMTLPYSRVSDRDAPWFVGRVLAAILKHCSLKKDAIDGLSVSSFSLAPDTVVSLAEHFGMGFRWLEQIPLGGASGVIAMRRAARAIQCGDAEVIACIGADTNKVGGFRDLVANFSRFSATAVYPHGAAGPSGVFALIARHYMETYGVTRADLGRISVAQRENARLFPHALLQKPLSLDDYLNARPIAEPFHLYDCVMPCAGAEGFLVMSEDRARSLNLPYAVIAAAEEYHNAYPEDPIQFRGGWDLFRDRLYTAAGFGPAEVDLVETYDDYPVICLMQLEDLGFCRKGEGARFLREVPLTIAGGGLPHNTSGGQLSCGQAGAAGGFLGLVEAIRQVTKQALGNQVRRASRALVSGYGMVNYDRGLCASAALITEGER